MNNMIDKNMRTSYKIAGILIVGLLFMWALYGLFGYAVIQQVYAGKSLPILNNIISGQDMHNVEHYHRMVDKVLLKGTFYLMFCCLIIILPSGVKLSLTSIFVTILLLEVGFGLREFYLTKKYPQHSDGADFLWQHDPVLGWKKKPNTENFYGSKENRIYAFSRTNSKGLRDDEYPYEKNQDTIRILAIGDSGVAGLEVNKEDHFDTHLEQLFSKSTKVEVINAGTRGYGTDQSYLYLKNEGYKYQPDIVLYIFFHNDPENNVTVHRPYRKYGKSYFVMNESDELVLKGTPVPKEFNPADRWIMANKEIEDFYNQYLEHKHHIFEDAKSDAAYNLMADVKKDVQDIYFRFQDINLMKWVRFKLKHNDKLENFLISKGLIRPRVTTSRIMEKPEFVLNQQWTITEKLIEEMAKFSDSIGSTFLIYEYTNNGHHQEPTRLSEACQKMDIAYFNSFKKFYEVSKGRKVLHFPYDEHWNERGHKLAAESIYSYMQKNEVLKEVKKKRLKTKSRQVVKIKKENL